MGIHGRCLPQGFALAESEPVIVQKLHPLDAAELPEDYYRILEHVGKYFSNDISLKRTASGKGVMTIRFDSDEEVSAFVKALEEKQF